MIPYGRQNITKDDINAVVEVLNSDFLTQGPVVPQFEKEVGVICNAKFSYAVNSATSALHLACLSLGVSTGDIVWTSPITFVASANCALYCGASIDFVDIDSDTYNISPDNLEIKLIAASLSGKIPKVLIVVHMCGQPANMVRINALAKQFGFRVIEDASHALGAKYMGDPVGSCKYSDITVFSFHPVKIITTGEGGMVLTNSPDLAKKISLLRSHGITRDPNEMTHTSDGAWYYQQIDLGFNYRMTEIQAALGLSQIKRLSEFVDKRHQISKIYDNAFKDLPIKIPAKESATISAMHLYVIRINHSCAKKNRKEIFDYLRSRSIGVNVHYIPVYMQPYYQKIGFEVGYCPNAEAYYHEAISLPMYYDLEIEDQMKVIESLSAALES